MALPYRTRFTLHALALAALHATSTGQTAEQVTITGRLEPLPASVAGFGDTPLVKSPFQALSLSRSLLEDHGADALSALTRLDASITDAYNAPGYWSALTVRGFVLDNRYNYLRDGLPINAETAIALENKERIEVLKGTSGAQAGTSAPGGLANLVVKRPRGSDQSVVFLGWSGRGNFKAATDLERRLGDGDALGLRLNAAVESLDPQVRDSKGRRHLLALAGSAQPTSDRRFDAEIEISHQSQPSMAGFSLLGNRVPSARDIDPRLNLNNQAWSQPVVFNGTTASLRWTETLGADWQLQAHVMSQRLRTDDRIAFPYGCSAEEQWDRYCSDGSFDLYDYRSENERRDTLAGALTLKGRAQWWGLSHELSTGLSWSDFRLHPNEQIYQWAGIGQIDGSVQVGEPAPDPYIAAGRHERSTELHLRDHLAITQDTGLWLGLRHSALDRSSEATDTDYRQSFTTPWIALSHQWTDALLVYGSWGQGVESDVAPNLPHFTNAGQPLPALKSEQVELGLKFSQAHWNASLTAFDIRRPQSLDLCDDTAATCTRLIDGNARHRGVEASGELHSGQLTLQASGMWLRARREGASNDATNGLIPPNVAERSARLMAGWQFTAITGLSAHASVSYEGPRYVLRDDNSISIPGWTTVGLATRYATRALGHEWLLRAGVDNLFDRRAWRESPHQFGHAYLYPLEPRSFRISFQTSL
ncbi:MAG TPA: TonB-dependent siderophore receptor [Ideonella sp.]|uniref:TonB-dependent siderophore receptor n=1 Tax=Ideonella sp. TaxID=1929293 RepID=UPI002E3223B7|nr:TonB-dependent siderophore receptor [Ideonella sp.]HEX5683159.1 TonB-dependent siderophore receptor [Ideonella sp.]